MIDQKGLFGHSSQINRRDFIRFFGLGAAGLILPLKSLDRVNYFPTPRTAGRVLGRVTEDRYYLHQNPDQQSEVIRELEKDSVFEITGLRLNQDTQSRNRLWYQIEGTGYAHSSRIQPVREQFNPVDTIILEDGTLGEITIPFVDAYKGFEKKQTPIYRFYYASTIWIVGRVVDADSQVWYKVMDDLYYNHYYVPAKSVRLVPASELTPISPKIAPEDKKLIVDLATQWLTAYEHDEVVYRTRLSSGVRMEEGGFATPVGHYRTTHKRPCRHMFTQPSEFGTGFDLPGVPWVSYFTRDGVAFHGTYWHNDFGVPHSHGCINLRPQDAKWVYRWTNPNVPPGRYYYSEIHGTRVIIQ